MPSIKTIRNRLTVLDEKYEELCEARRALDVEIEKINKKIFFSVDQICTATARIRARKEALQNAKAKKEFIDRRVGVRFPPGPDRSGTDPKPR